MKRPEPTRRQVEKFIKTSQAKLRMELVLDFDRPVSVAVARESARRMLDGLQAESSFAAPEEFAQASLRCAELRRVVRIEVPGRE